MSTLPPTFHPVFHWDAKAIEPTNPVLKAAYGIMQKAHENEFRKKDGVEMPYIHHTIAAMNILRTAGIHDQITLAAALLHDVLEQGHFEANREGLQDELKAGIFSAFLEYGHEIVLASILADSVSAEIVTAVEELTNDPEMLEGKRFAQSDKMDRISPRARMIKMADLSATLLEDLLYASHKPKEELERMYHRAFTVVKKCYRERPSLFYFFRSLYEDNLKLLKEEIERPDPSEYLLKITETRSEPGKWINERDDEKACEQACKGVVSVRIDHYGRVNSFRMAVDPFDQFGLVGLPKGVNELTNQMVEAADALQPEIYCSDVAPISLFSNRIIARKITPEMPIEVGEFLKTAARHGAMSKGFIRRVAATAEQLKESLIRDEGRAMQQTKAPSSAAVQPSGYDGRTSGTPDISAALGFGT